MTVIKEHSQFNGLALVCMRNGDGGEVGDILLGYFTFFAVFAVNLSDTKDEVKQKTLSIERR